MAGVHLPQGRAAIELGLPGVICSLVDFDSQYPAASYDVASIGDVLTLSGDWNSGAFAAGVSVLSVGDSVEFSVDQFQFVAGLSGNAAPTGGWSEVDFGFYCASPSQFYVLDDGVFIAVGSCSVGDTLRLVVNGAGFVEFFHNGVLVHTSSVAVSVSLYPCFTGGNNNSATLGWEVCSVPAALVLYARVASVLPSPDVYILKHGYVAVGGDVVVPSAEALSVLHGYEVVLEGK